ncbi:MAG: Flagellin B1 precursor [Methanomassiliicoccales archaeon PtaU1.Bin124]|nr:MAG: Flagellin B1 precursor [Methanomassiliicoccales archaeon PtaU1.Bin124]
MNKNWLKMKNDKRAEMGVGTMIIFIAMVLVAAVAASVLISTANTVREQAQATGEQAINNVASGFVVQDVVGMVGTDKLEITETYLFVRLAAGSPEINLDNVMVEVTTASLTKIMSFSLVDSTNAWADVTNGTAFGCERIKDASGYPWADSSHVVGQGDLLKLYVSHNAATGLNIGFSETVEIKIIPAYGQMSYITFTTGEAFPADYITLA